MAKLIVSISRRDINRYIRTLGRYQDRLESAVKSELVEGEFEPRGEFGRSAVKALRKEWREAEALVTLLLMKRDG